MSQGPRNSWTYGPTGIRAENGDLVCDAPDPYECTHLTCNVGKPKRTIAFPSPADTVGASIALLTELSREGSPFEVLEDFHPGFADSVTLVHPGSNSALTFVIVEVSSEEGH